MTLSGAEWLEERRKGLGSSDIAAIMGLSKWRTPYQVYLEKRGEAADVEENEVMDWGTRLEPAIRQWYSDTTGRTVLQPDKIIRHPQYPFITASLDGFTEDGRIVEIKTSRNSTGWGEPGTDQIPENYTLQVQTQLLVTGFQVADVPVSIGGAPPVIYTLEADPELHDMIIDAATEFWTRVVEGNQPPPTTFAEAVQRFGKSKATGAVIASKEVAEYCAELKSVRAAIKAMEEKEDQLKTNLISCIGDAGDTLIDLQGNVLATYKLAKARASFDTKNFQKQYPDLYNQFTKEGEATRRFLLKGE